jgi:endonuclease YncB( thermonuclease family)
MLKSFAIAMLGLSVTLSAYAAEMTGKVIRIADGDTLTVLVDCAKLDVPIRLAGIDAPEKGMPFGTVSKQSLADLAFGKQVVVEWRKKDKYGRVVGKVLVDGLDVNLEQVKRGLAWHFKEYEGEQSAEDREAYAAAEATAKAAGAGLWKDKEPTPPWAWRKAKRAADVEAPADVQ